MILRTGERRIGRVLEWGTLVMLQDRCGEIRTYRRTDVRDLRVDRDFPPAPERPDLTVAYIERIPRDPGWHGKVAYDREGRRDLGILTVDPTAIPWHPRPGQEVTFRVHARNAGRVASGAFAWRARMDRWPLGEGRVEGIDAGAERVIEVPWIWQAGHHALEIELDTGRQIEEIAEWNNRFVDPVRALTFFFVVDRKTYDAFARDRNLLGTYGFEDWAQYHVHMMDALFAASVYPSAPEGILERVRIDRIVVADLADPKARARWDRMRRRGGDPAGIIEYNGNWEFGAVRNREHARAWMARVDWGLPHELGHQLGLIDIYQLNTDVYDCFVRGADGGYANVMHFFPWPRTMMHWHGPHTFSEQGAGYLNATLGRPRGYFGDYLYAVPRECWIEVRAIDGRPLAGADVEIFQRKAWGPYIHRVAPEPVATGRTDARGLCRLPNRPAPHHRTVCGFELRDNPWGHIHVVGFNGLLLVRLRCGGAEEYHWLRIFDFNVAWFRGHRDRYVHRLRTHFAASGAPAPPAEVEAVFFRNPGRVDMELRWRPSPTEGIAAYHVWRKAGHGGDSVRPFRLLEVVPRERIGGDGRYHRRVTFGEECEFDGFYAKDSTFAVSAIDGRGRESGLSRRIYVPKAQRVRALAAGPDGIYLTFIGSQDALLRWRPAEGFRDVGLRALKVPGYRPSLAGIAFVAPRGGAREGAWLVATDWARHQVVLFDRRGDLVRMVGNPERDHGAPGDAPGAFREPVDIAVDARGRLYVADRGNHRVQVLDPEGRHLVSLTPGGDGEGFRDLAAVGALGDGVTVTDRYGGRVYVFRVPPGDRICGRGDFTRVLALEGVRDPRRALVAPSGRIYVPGRDPEDRWAVLVYRSDGTFERAIHDAGGVRLVDPRGLAPDGRGGAYVVNDFPFEIARVELE